MPSNDKTWDCPKCGKNFPLNQPLTLHGMIGYTSGIHECGPGFESVVLTPASEEKKAFWRKVLS
jgi:hypothetical protein